MNKKTLTVIISIAFILCAGTIIFLALGGFALPGDRKNANQIRTRLIIPGETESEFQSPVPAQAQAAPENFNVKAPMGDGESIVSVINQDFSGDSVEDQFIVYRNLTEPESPVYAAYIEYDAASRSYGRVWSTPTASARQGTVSLYTQDLIGDRVPCVLITGMSGQGEHTMTIFRWNSPAREAGPVFVKIAELRISGSIVIQETERTQAYRLGIANGHSFTIAAYGHDLHSDNILDQTESIYTYNSRSGLYEQSRVTLVPGSQIEQRRLRELLGGQPGVFENFINDLWYYVSPQGTMDNRQYIYFDPASRELIFFGDETQQVFTWQNSTPTRYGLYISSQNISVSTLRRFVDIELESLDSIRVKVFEDVRLKIGVSTTWDGSYRRAGTVAKTQAREEKSLKPYIDAVYDSSMGRLQFLPDGRYELNSGAVPEKGSYVFFEAAGQELLEMRPATDTRGAQNSGERTVYRVERGTGGERENSQSALSLTRVRLGTTGLEIIHGGTIVLTAQNPR